MALLLLLLCSIHHHLSTPLLALRNLATTIPAPLWSPSSSIITDHRSHVAHWVAAFAQHNNNNNNPPMGDQPPAAAQVPDQAALAAMLQSLATAIQTIRQPQAPAPILDPFASTDPFYRCS